MRGRPLWQTMLVALAFLAVANPVWRLTHPADAATPVQVPSAPIAKTDAPLALTVTATFSPAPVNFQITSAGKSVLAGIGPQTEFTAEWSTVIPKDGLDLSVQASWPDTAPPGPRATRVIVRYPDGHQVDKTLWTAAGNPLGDLVTVLPNP